MGRSFKEGRKVIMIYSEKVMEHFQNPRNVGEIENPSGLVKLVMLNVEI